MPDDKELEQSPQSPGGTWKEWLKIGLPIVLLTAVAFGVAWHFVQPAPPSHVVIATGSKEGMYYKFAQQYADYFASNGVTLEVRETKGSIENYKLLTASDSGVDIAIVQGGVAPPLDQRPNLQAVAGVFFEPVWVFHRLDTPVTRLKDLAGKTIAVGGEGSGVRPLAMTLLNEAGLATPTDTATTISPLGGEDAATALREKKIDAMFAVIAPGAPLIAKLIQSPGIHLMNFEQAKAYGRLHRFLSPVTLYKGSISIEKNLPDADAELVAAPAALIMRSSTHQAIIQLLVGAAQHVHSGGTLLSDSGRFPAADGFELERNKDAHFFLTNKPGFLQRTFPFWLASLIDRLWILLLPLLAVLLPLFRMFPPLYKWRIRSRIYRWYKRVRFIDERLDEHSRRDTLESGRTELISIEKEVLQVRVPLSYMEELYNLRMHAGYVRGRVESWLKATSNV